MPLAIVHTLRVDDETSRRFTVFSPEIPLILAGFPNLSKDKVDTVNTGRVEDVNTLDRWQNHCRVRAKWCKAQYGSANPNVEPAGWTEAWRAAEAAALVLMEKRDASRAQKKRDAAKAAAKSSAKPTGRQARAADEVKDDALAAMSGGPSIPPFKG